MRISGLTGPLPRSFLSLESCPGAFLFRCTKDHSPTLLPPPPVNSLKLLNSPKVPFPNLSFLFVITYHSGILSRMGSGEHLRSLYEKGKTKLKQTLSSLSASAKPDNTSASSHSATSAVETEVRPGGAHTGTGSGQSITVTTAALAPEGTDETTSGKAGDVWGGPPGTEQQAATLARSQSTGTVATVHTTVSAGGK